MSSRINGSSRSCFSIICCTSISNVIDSKCCSITITLGNSNRCIRTSNTLYVSSINDLSSRICSSSSSGCNAIYNKSCSSTITFGNCNGSTSTGNTLYVSSINILTSTICSSSRSRSSIGSSTSIGNVVDSKCRCSAITLGNCYISIRTSNTLYVSRIDILTSRIYRSSRCTISIGSVIYFDITRISPSTITSQIITRLTSCRCRNKTMSTILCSSSSYKVIILSIVILCMNGECRSITTNKGNRLSIYRCIIDIIRKIISKTILIGLCSNTINRKFII